MCSKTNGGIAMGRPFDSDGINKIRSKVKGGNRSWVSPKSSNSKSNPITSGSPIPWYPLRLIHSMWRQYWLKATKVYINGPQKASCYNLNFPWVVWIQGAKKSSHGVRGNERFGRIEQHALRSYVYPWPFLSCCLLPPFLSSESLMAVLVIFKVT